MNPGFANWLGLCLAIGFATTPATTLRSQSTNTTVQNKSGAPAPAGRIGPPTPPLFPAKSPVDFFRELLAMPTMAERRLALTNRTAEAQRLILAKVREYELMRPNLREERLRVTELHFYLLPLMKAPPGDRAAQLAAIPEDDRKLVEERLREWDKLSGPTQKELLENYATIRWLEGRTEPPKPGPPEQVAPALEPGLRRWQELSENQRRTIVQRFKEFFELKPEEKERVFRTLSETERTQIENTLNQFAKLNAAQRAQCLASFRKFANLSPEERRQFLKSAEQWKLMTPDQRQAWKNLVNKLPPPLPGADQPPPLPRAATPPRTGAAVVTNSN